jgi:hypothetical protein
MLMMQIAVGAVRAVGVARVGARLFGHPSEVLEQIHQGLRPARMELRQERAEQFSQHMFGGQPVPSDNDSEGDEGGLDNEGSPSINDEAGTPLENGDTEGISDLFRSAAGWVRDQL